MRKLENESWPIEILSMKGLGGLHLCLPASMKGLGSVFLVQEVINVVVVSSMSVILS